MFPIRPCLKQHCTAVASSLTPPGQRSLCCPAERVQLDEALHAQLERSAGMPLDSMSALLLPDLASAGRLAGLTASEAIAIELKPKWGALPSSPWVRGGVKLRTSRFQLLQKLKAARVSSFSRLQLT